MKLSGSVLLSLTFCPDPVADGIYYACLRFLHSNCELNNIVSAVGCTNMIPPENAWLRRSNNDIIIGCYSSQQTWQLNCDGRQWKGLVGTCPESCKSRLVCCHESTGRIVLKYFFDIFVTVTFENWSFCR